MNDKQQAILDGRSTYDGRPCRTCGTTRKYVAHSSCIQCQHNRYANDTTYREDAKAKARLNYAANIERRKAVQKLYRDSQPVARHKARSNYEARLKRATPEWLTKDQWKEIAQVYQTCPEGEQVDHAVALNAKGVCGLHVPWNLQHLPETENFKKSAKFEQHHATDELRRAS